MPEPMRTHPIELTFIGPSSNKRKAVKVLESLGFVEQADTIPWREAFPDLEGKAPGIILAGARHKEGFTQKELSKLTGIPQAHISAMENNKRSLGKKTALKLAQVLKVGYKIFL